ncbi:amidase family protein [Frigidibacter sp. RF13]|uniref:amidase n=1 Tax=Frigidibacter sp. RF13 TaxID=2997340 RepID=UPI00226F87CF|nr:amidase family protein [Frigidibacter sp. RF13]MCY1126572.1 amidase family protein [Frigidibacter sp. RF13]
MTYWRGMSAAEQGRAIGRGDLIPTWLVEDYLAAIHADPAADRIYARLTEDRALAEAEAAEARAKAGLRLSPLDGVPVSWKDLFDTAGVATEAGSQLLAGRVPGRDAEVLRNATAMGLVCLGKTHMTELAFSGLGLNPMTATPPNVNDAALVPGGSSSGAAASVAFGLAAAAVGSDTGGSVRIPAAWNNLVGLKTTHGRVAKGGVVPLVERFDTVGPLTRTVEDAALMLAALEGTKPADLTGASLKGARLAVIETVALENCRDTPLAAFDEALARLSDRGARIERVAFPALTEAFALAGVLFTTEAYGIWREVIEAAPDRMYPPVRERFRSGAQYSGADFVAAWRRLHAIRTDWAALVAGYDAVLAPTAAILPPDARRLETDPDYFTAENLLALRNTRIANLMGLPALTLPTATPACGLMLMGRAMGEEALLRLGAAAETTLSA